jgi:hypothetical protein
MGHPFLIKILTYPWKVISKKYDYLYILIIIELLFSIYNILPLSWKLSS